MPNETAGGSAAVPLIGPNEPDPVECVEEAGGLPLILVCDHASARIPSTLETLGLDEAELSRHIAIDIGAAGLTRNLAWSFGAPAVLAGYSRLVIDCNRDPRDHTSIREISEGVVVPGNRRLTAAQRAARIREVFEPYHAAVAGRIAAIETRGSVPALVAIHSFTPRFRGFERPWHVGVLSGADRRIADPLLRALCEDAALVVGDNEPYSGMHFAGYTMETHAVLQGLPCVMIEVRQDLLGDAAGIDRWTGLLHRALAPILAEESLYEERGA